MTKIKFRYFICGLVILFSTKTIAEDSMYWMGNFGEVSLGNLATQSDIKTASASVVLFTTGDCELSANRTIAARLSGEGDNLITEYKLEFDGNGSSKTGSSTVDYESYDNFISSPLIITHVSFDDQVSITLSVRARNNPNNIANAGNYSATQTLTVSWAGL